MLINKLLAEKGESEIKKQMMRLLLYNSIPDGE